MSEGQFEIIEGKLNSIENLLLNKTPQHSLKSIPEQPISQAAAVKFLGVTTATLIRWRNQGLIKAHRISGRVFYLHSELVSALEMKG